MHNALTEPQKQQMTRWRLLLGDSVAQQTDGFGISLGGDDAVLDEALAAIYDETGSFQYGEQKSKSAGRGKSSPYVARWLGDIRKYFREDVVSVIQNDAMERKGLSQLLLEPEVLRSVKPDLGMVTTLLSLKNKIPDKAKETAREIVRTVSEEIRRRLDTELRRSVTGAINRRAHSVIPSASAVDWPTTIRKNITHYDSERGVLIPSRFVFFDRSQKRNKWHIILALDQSGSMADSVVYASVAGCILASISAVQTHVIAFDTEVVDLREACGSDPVDMLFGVQLGGGTDIEKAVAYCTELITEPRRTVLIVVSDMCEGGNRSRLISRVQDLCESGVRCVGLLSLTDRGHPSYDSGTAKALAAVGMPCFAATPNKLAPLLEAAIKGGSLVEAAK